MTVQASDQTSAEVENLVTLTIDDVKVSVPKGTLVIRAAEMIGVQIPRFCDHPLLDPVGACRQCLVDIPDAGNGRGFPKPQASCTIEVAEGMVVRTQLTSGVADKAQQGIMEFLLINHPLDCPVCDKGGECPLQNQAMSNGRPESRFTEVKRTYPKPINISSQVLLDRERCVLCARCTRFSKQVAGDPFIELLERGALQQVGIYEKEPFSSYFSGNTIQICPVGALTSAQYRFRSRPFDLVSTPGTCEHCSNGCSIRTDHRRGKVMRRLAGDDPEVNEEWICDKGRFAFRYAATTDRLTHPLVRDEDTGELRPASWSEAFRVAAEGLAAARGRAGVLTGGRVTLEDAYAYSKFARVALNTNNVDFRSRPHSHEEADFLSSAVAGTGLGVTYRDLERASAVLLVGLEVEEEAPIVFLRLRKAVSKGGTKVTAMAPYTTSGLEKLSGTLLRAAPGTEAEFLDALHADGADSGLDEAGRAAAEALRGENAVILVGSRLAGSPGALSAVLRLAEETGARLAWVPRRAGERGAVDAGCLPHLLPGGRPSFDAAARVDVAAAWGVGDLPIEPGRDAATMLTEAAEGDLGALVVGGVEIDDLPDPAAARAGLERAGFVVSLELSPTEVTKYADVVFPVAAVAEKAGSFVDWEGRARPFERALAEAGHQSDLWVLAGLADELDAPLGFTTVEGARAELTELGAWDGARAVPPRLPAPEPAQPSAGEAVLATWPQLIDDGALLAGEPHLAGTARPVRARLSATTATALGVVEGDSVVVSTTRGRLNLPVEVADLPDQVVWVPTHSHGSHVYDTLGVDAGALVDVARAERVPQTVDPAATDQQSPNGSAAGSTASQGGTA
ncbi:NADH-quinone oxidoreductase subunit G [Actinopolymorpha singaporensis]|uniref:NADH-quinone oxidoreductase n=1 Tax=Actinopolymorpha singaporensis TaxID=117157 RepID=A0A1H1QSA9_9ACTN|nr:NADH-quinone oxidoreductase subunit G [Actinopolymorpha singaporensis]SDS26295.1 NADH dehydrogenase subunit G [Actinopolymorpha singaporensis]